MVVEDGAIGSRKIEICSRRTFVEGNFAAARLQLLVREDAGARQKKQLVCRSMFLKILNFTLMLFRALQGRKRAQISFLSGFILLARIKAKFSRF